LTIDDKLININELNNYKIKILVMKNYFFKPVTYLVILLIVLSIACQKENNNDSTAKALTHADSVANALRAVDTLYAIMNTFYLWRDSMPAVDKSKYTNPTDLLDAMIYAKRDKWSYIMSYNEYVSYFQEGQFVGYGVLFGAQSDTDIRIAFLYNESPLYLAGVRRGWRVLNINGTTLNSSSNITSLLSSTSNSFEFEKPDGTTVTASYSKTTLTVNTVLYRDTANINGTIVGHLVFESFIETSKAELDEAFAYFKNAGATELVLDLRYNGGGEVSIAQYLASLMNSSVTSGKVFLNFAYNKYVAKYNDTTFDFLSPSNSLSLNRIFFITSRSTASASEAVINGLRPFFPNNIFLIGDTTDGKPVGMNVFAYTKMDYAFVPITFQLTNSEGYGGYFAGIPVDKVSSDDFTHDFGDKEEACFKQALYYISNGSFTSKKSKQNIHRMNHRLHGLKAEIGSY
jgi:carboxyl-terminal processing protease